MILKIYQGLFSLIVNQHVLVLSCDHPYSQIHFPATSKLTSVPKLILGMQCLLQGLGIAGKYGKYPCWTNNRMDGQASVCAYRHSSCPQSLQVLIEALVAGYGNSFLSRFKDLCFQFWMAKSTVDGSVWQILVYIKILGMTMWFYTRTF